MPRITRQKKLSETVEVVVERSALGQSVEYDVFRVEGETRKYLGGGSKREAQRVFDGVKS